MKTALTGAFALATLLLIFSGRIAHAESAYLPLVDELVASASYTFETFDEFWVGSDHESLDSVGIDDDVNGEITQQTLTLSFEYGLSEALALDLSIGATRTDGLDVSSNASPATLAISDALGDLGGDDSGLDDTRLGIRWRLYDEFSAVDSALPTVTLHLGAIIEGTYDVGSITDAGDGASGIESSILLGKAFIEQGAGVFAQAGIRLRNEDVPDTLLLNGGAYYLFSETVSTTLSYSLQQDLSGIDVLDERFTPDRFPETKEITDRINAAIDYTDAGGRTYALFGGWTLGRRNTPKKLILGLSFSVPFAR